MWCVRPCRVEIEMYGKFQPRVVSKVSRSNLMRTIYITITIITIEHLGMDKSGQQVNIVNSKQKHQMLRIFEWNGTKKSGPKQLEHFLHFTFSFLNPVLILIASEHSSIQCYYCTGFESWPKTTNGLTLKAKSSRVSNPVSRTLRLTLGKFIGTKGSFVMEWAKSASFCKWCCLMSRMQWCSGKIWHKVYRVSLQSCQSFKEELKRSGPKSWTCLNWLAKHGWPRIIPAVLVMSKGVHVHPANVSQDPMQRSVRCLHENHLAMFRLGWLLQNLSLLHVTSRCWSTSFQLLCF